MTLWFVFALMTAAAVFTVLWPLSRRAPGAGGSDVAVYRDQYDEIVRDRAAGLIGEAEADAAKIEVSRRLIAAADVAAAAGPAGGQSVWRTRATALTGLVLLPIGAALIYLALGSPQLPGEPLATRTRAPQPNTSIADLVSRAEAHLERNPDDARGYELLAPIYLRLGRAGDAVAARRKLLTLHGENAERQADLGEALTAAGNGIVTVEAKAAFERAVALDPGELKAVYFLGVAAEQDGDRAKAAAIWRKMLDGAPPDAPWIPIVRESLARLGEAPPPMVATPAPVAPAPAAAAPAAPGPSAQDIAAANQMSEQDRSEMVRGMVARLADRLQQNGDDVEGWLRLLRAYMVLGERDKASAAAADARRALANDPEKLRRIDDVVRSMGLNG